MPADQHLLPLWHQQRERLVAKGLLGGANAALSLRFPGTDAMWFGRAGDTVPRRLTWRDQPQTDADAALHAIVYAAREDVCAAASGGGPFGLCLADFGGALPGVFDEQVRHLGRMPAPPRTADRIAAALGPGGNVLLVRGQPLVLGMTAARLALNAELFEKCAKAYVLAVAGGGAVKALPWLVRYVANGRLMKDERRARARVQQGLLPEESKGY